MEEHGAWRSTAPGGLQEHGAWRSTASAGARLLPDRVGSSGQRVGTCIWRPPPRQADTLHCSSGESQHGQVP